MKYLPLLWIVFGSFLLNTWKDIFIFYWRNCTYIGRIEEKKK